jgi:hypothetical protein
MTWKEGWKCCSFHNQTFSRCGSESKMLSRTFAELKTDILNTSIGSPNRLRRQPVRFDPFADTARERARLSDVQNDAAVYFALSQSTENFIDGIERQLLDRRLHFAFGGKGERFLKIFSCADDRSSESEAT